MLIIAAVLFVLGMLVRKYPNLIAGYNTMTAEQKKNVDVMRLEGAYHMEGRTTVFDLDAVEKIIKQLNKDMYGQKNKRYSGR